MRHLTAYIRTAASTTLLGFVTLTAQAATVSLMADLKGSSEVPANTSAGTGMVMGTLDTDTHELKYTVTFSGLTGDATAAHFHGPAEPGKNAPPVVVVKGPIESGLTGTATVTEAQQADMLAGKYYFNVHTAAHPAGELRGQVVKSGS